MNIREIIAQTTCDFAGAGLTSPRLDAEVLLAHSLNTDRTGLYKNLGKAVDGRKLNDFKCLSLRRRRGEPVAYIVGAKEFWSRPFAVDDRVLVPRPETEILVEEILSVCEDLRDRELRILELGTGSGAVSVTLALELADALFWATDISPGALAVAKSNAMRYAVADRISFLWGDVFAPVSGTYHIIMSNPPYIPDGEFNGLSREIRCFEPAAALLGGTSGTDIHRNIIEHGYLFLERGGWLFLEIGFGQSSSIEDMLRADGRYERIGFRRDYSGIERVVRARRKSTSG